MQLVYDAILDKSWLHKEVIFPWSTWRKIHSYTDRHKEQDRKRQGHTEVMATQKPAIWEEPTHKFSGKETE